MLLLIKRFPRPIISSRPLNTCPIRSCVLPERLEDTSVDNVGADITTCVTVTVSKIAVSQIVMLKLLDIWSSGLLLLLLVVVKAMALFLSEGVSRFDLGPLFDLIWRDKVVDSYLYIPRLPRLLCYLYNNTNVSIAIVSDH